MTDPRAKVGEALSERCICGHTRGQHNLRITVDGFRRTGMCLVRDCSYHEFRAEDRALQGDGDGSTEEEG